MTTKKYQILSPDGFTINLEEYTSPENAWSGFDEWKKRFTRQGYYSSNDGRISLSDLKSHCKLTTL